MFDTICDEWDKLNTFPTGYTKRTQCFFNNGDTSNIFGYFLQKYGYSVKFIGYDFHEKKPPLPSNAIGAIVFNTSHTWSIRKHADNMWWIHDSLRLPTKYIYRPNDMCAFLYCFHK